MVAGDQPRKLITSNFEVYLYIGFDMDEHLLMPVHPPDMTFGLLFFIGRDRPVT